MMTPSDLVIVDPRSQPFTLLPGSHILFLVPLLLGEVIDDGQKPRIAKRYRLDRLSQPEQKQVASEACNHPLSTSSPCLNVFPGGECPSPPRDGDARPRTNHSLLLGPVAS